MFQKKAGVLVGFLLIFIIIFSSLISAVNCEIVDKVECALNNRVFGLSDVENAHGEVYNGAGNYPQVLCCDGSTVRNCQGGNKILGLSSTTNAHAEKKELSNYTTNICYGQLNCTWSETNPDINIYSDENIILSLSGNTNAHIGHPGNYALKMWCKDTNYIGTYCGDDNVDIGEQCDLGDQNGVPGSSCASDCLCADGYTYNPLTKVCEFQAFGIAVYWSDDYTTLIGTSGVTVNVGSTKVHMILTNLGRTVGETISFEIYEDDTLGDFTTFDDDIRVGEDAIDVVVEDPNLIKANWTISYSDIEKTNDYEEFYFKVFDSEDNEIVDSRDYHNPGEGVFGYLEFISTHALPCTTISLCMDYGQNSCENDAALCQVADFSVMLNNPDITCGVGGITCECWWDETEETCNSRWGDGTGWCEYGESIENECTQENLFLTYIFTAVWSLTGEENPPDCVGGSNVLPCPAQIQLPFVNIYNIIAIIVAIVLIYFLMNLKKKKRKVSKKKK